MATLIEMLRRLNRKERFFLVARAVSNQNDTFPLHHSFRDQLGTTLDLAIPEAGVFCAMDYHLDWLFAAIEIAKDDAPTCYPSPGWLDREGNPTVNVNANQEDIDLVVAFEDGPTTHIILIEAKGETGWSSSQMLSKALRLTKIFGAEGEWNADVRPHFVLTSPTKPTRWNVDAWPAWMKADAGKPHFIELPLPEDRVRIQRCDPTGKQEIKGGLHWRRIPFP